MIELPEAITIARQMNEALTGKRIAEGVRGNSPHKFAFYNRTPEEYAALLQGKAVGKARSHGCMILLDIEPGYVLTLGGGGERIVLHRHAQTLPKKHQLLLHFVDDSYLSVTVQGWGSAQLVLQSEVDRHVSAGPGGAGPSPLSDAFTPEYFREMVGRIEAGDPRSVKLFLTSKPGVLGIGNGCLQDILFHARIHPRRRLVDITDSEQRALYDAIRSTLAAMVDQGGRDSDYDLYNHLGGYKRILHSKSVGQPCPNCGTPFEKAAYLGGSVYFCPTCQV
jgi:formamidopyrimidine-DNA glycosylase